MFCTYLEREVETWETRQSWWYQWRNGLVSYYNQPFYVEI